DGARPPQALARRDRDGARAPPPAPRRGGARGAPRGAHRSGDAGPRPADRRGGPRRRRARDRPLYCDRAPHRRVPSPLGSRRKHGALFTKDPEMYARSIALAGALVGALSLFGCSSSSSSSSGNPATPPVGPESDAEAGQADAGNGPVDDAGHHDSAVDDVPPGCALIDLGALSIISSQ